MKDTTEQVIMTTKPSIKTIGFGLVGTLFFGAFVYLMLSMKWNVAAGTDYKTGMAIMWVILGIFIFFSVGSLWTIFNIKTIILTSKTLIINRPFLLFKKTIPIDNIRQVTETPFKINPTIRWRTYNVYEGKQISLEFRQGKAIKLNSFEIPEYYSFTKNLNKLRRTKEESENEAEEFAHNKNQGYGWLILICLLTFGLIYSIIKQKL